MPPNFTPNIQWTLLKNLIRSFKLRLRGFHPLRQDIPVNFNFFLEDFKPRLITPHLLLVSQKNSVCPIPFSLDVTHGIAIAFFSSAY